MLQEPVSEKYDHRQEEEAQPGRCFPARTDSHVAGTQPVMPRARARTVSLEAWGKQGCPLVLKGLRSQTGTGTQKRHTGIQVPSWSIKWEM